MKSRDLVVVGSDGLFDNLFDKDMKPCLIKELKKEADGSILLADPGAAAQCLANSAYQKSKDRRYESPFSVGAKRAGMWHHSGKEDDITVIVA